MLEFLLSQFSAQVDGESGPDPEFATDQTQPNNGSQTILLFARQRPHLLAQHHNGQPFTFS